MTFTIYYRMPEDSWEVFYTLEVEDMEEALAFASKARENGCKGVRIACYEPLRASK